MWKRSCQQAATWQGCWLSWVAKLSSEPQPGNKEFSGCFFCHTKWMSHCPGTTCKKFSSKRLHQKWGSTFKIVVLSSHRAPAFHSGDSLRKGCSGNTRETVFLCSLFLWSGSMLGGGKAGPARRVFVVFSLLVGTLLSRFNETSSPQTTRVCHSSINSYMHLTNIFLNLCAEIPFFLIPKSLGHGGWWNLEERERHVIK